MVKITHCMNMRPVGIPCLFVRWSHLGSIPALPDWPSIREGAAKAVILPAIMLKIPR